MNSLLEKINNIFIDIGFKKVIINGETFFQYKELYCKISYVKGLHAFVIESAEGFAEAEKNILEDSGVYSLNLGENKILSIIKKDLLNYYIN